MNIKKIKADFEKKYGYILMPAGIDENHAVYKYIKTLEKIIKGSKQLKKIIKDSNKIQKNIARLQKKYK